MVTADPPPLLAVVLLFRAKNAFADLPHVVSSVSTFLDSAVELPLSEACKFGSLVLLSRIWNSSDTRRDGSEGPWSPRKYLRADRNYMQHQFSQSVRQAIELHDLKMLEWLFDRFQGFVVDERIQIMAVYRGHKDILQFFLDNDNDSLQGEALELVRSSGAGHWIKWHKLSMEAATEKRRNDIVWWLHKHRRPNQYGLNSALDAAVRQDDVILAEWLTTQGAAWHYPAQRAVSSGHLTMLQWLAEQGQVDVVEGLVVKAAQLGHFHIVRWLLNRSAQTTENVLDLGGEASLSIHAACVHGHLEIAKYLYGHSEKPRNSIQRYIHASEQGINIAMINERETWHQVHTGATPASVSGKTMTEAAGKGFLDVVQWLYAEYGGDPDVDLFDYGAVNEQTGQQPVQTVAMDAAASNGHLDVLKYLHELQISIASHARKRERNGELKAKSKPYCTDTAMVCAAGHGHIEVVKWLHDNQALVYSADAVDVAAVKGNLELVQWMLSHGTEECTSLAMDGAARNGHMETVKWLHANTSGGCTTAAMDGAAGNGHLDVVQWLHKHRSEGCATKAMDAAARNGHLQVVKWLHRNRNEGCTTEAIDRAAQKGHFRVVQWLQKHRSEGCTSRGFNAAAASSYFDILLFLHFHYGDKCTESATRAINPRNIRAIDRWILQRYPSFNSRARNA